MGSTPGTVAVGRAEVPVPGTGQEIPKPEQDVPELQRGIAGPGQSPARSSQLSPAERIELLCDAGSVRTIRSLARSRQIAAASRAGDGVLAASGTVAGRPVLCYAQDYAFLGGSLGEAHADTIVRALEFAGRAGVPVFALIESAGARVQEAAAALNGYARIFRRIVSLSGQIPQISILSGISAGGGSYSPALTDFVVMARSATMFLTGPEVVDAALGERTTMDELGGAAVHARNGVCDLVAPSPAEALALGRELLAYLPQSSREAVLPVTPVPPAITDPASSVPAAVRNVYDVRDVVAGIVDGGELLELSPLWARSLLTGFARLQGRSVGVLANQPRHKGGAIDLEAAQKGARFIRTCDAFGLPLVVLVDTPGFLPGSRQEQRGIIRHGADLVRAFAAASVPKVTVILRQAFGGAYIAMNGFDLGADFTLAWRDARIGIMSALQTVGIVSRREIAAAPEPATRKRELAERYAIERQTAQAVAGEGFIDEVIDPRDTRDRLSAVLETLAGGLGSGRSRKIA
jgi:acetyl-CoA carboxylase carboxyltransferase component